MERLPEDTKLEDIEEQLQKEIEQMEEKVCFCIV